jgi:hypothetical protein
MSNPWFRFYAAALRNPKVAALSDRDFRLWVSLLAAASENDGILPPAKDLKHMLKTRLDHLLTGLDRLISGGLIDALEHGYTPHNWNKFQYKSDTSTERVHRHRSQRNVSETPPDTEQNHRQKIEPPAQQTGPAARASFDPLQNRLLEAAGIAGFRDERHPGLANLAPARGWLEKGYDLDRDILPVIRDKARNKTFSSWAIFTAAIVEATAAKSAIPPRPAATPDDWHGRLRVFREDGTWAAAWGPKPDEPGCKAPAELLRTAA